MTEALNRIINILLDSIRDEDFVNKSYELTEILEEMPDAFDAIEPILRLMEDNPEIEFGTPGPLVHFLEKFYGKGYEEKLVASVVRRPTKHTVWMLNRLINGSEGDRKQYFIGVLKQVLTQPHLNEDVRELAQHFWHLHIE